jgi:hypothetical protein
MIRSEWAIRAICLTWMSLRVVVVLCRLVVGCWTTMSVDEPVDVTDEVVDVVEVIDWRGLSSWS